MLVSVAEREGPAEIKLPAIGALRPLDSTERLILQSDSKQPIEEQTLKEILINPFGAKAKQLLGWQEKSIEDFVRSLKELLQGRVVEAINQGSSTVRVTGKGRLNQLALILRRLEDVVLSDEPRLWMTVYQDQGVSKLWGKITEQIYKIAFQQDLGVVWNSKWSHYTASILALQIIDVMRCVSNIAHKLNINPSQEAPLVPGYSTLRAHPLTSTDIGIAKFDRLDKPAWVEFHPAGTVVYLSPEDFNRYHPRTYGVNFSSSSGVLSLVRLVPPHLESEILKTRQHELLHGFYCSFYGIESIKLTSALDRLHSAVERGETKVKKERATIEIRGEFRRSLLKFFSNEERSYRLTGDTNAWLSPNQLGFGFAVSLFNRVCLQALTCRDRDGSFVKMIEELRVTAHHCIKLSFRRQVLTIYLANSQNHKILPKNWLELLTSYGVGKEIQVLKTMTGSNEKFIEHLHSITTQAEKRLVARLSALADLIDVFRNSGSQIKNSEYQQRFDTATQRMTRAFAAEVEVSRLINNLLADHKLGDYINTARELIYCLTRTIFEALPLCDMQCLPLMARIIEGLKPSQELESLWQLVSNLMILYPTESPITSDTLKRLSAASKRTLSHLDKLGSSEIWVEETRKHCVTVASHIDRLTLNQPLMLTNDLGASEIRSLLEERLNKAQTLSDRLHAFADIISRVPSKLLKESLMIKPVELAAFSLVFWVGDEDISAVLKLSARLISHASNPELVVESLNLLDSLFNSRSLHELSKHNHDVDKLIAAINVLHGTGVRSSLSEKVLSNLKKSKYIRPLFPFADLFNHPPFDPVEEVG